jgi:ABC-2 type transport system ATP-binding protein
MHRPMPVVPPGPCAVTLARLQHARKSYGAVLALDNVDLEVRAGEVLAVLGSNGAGKTTALGLISGRIAPDAGRAELLGGDPREARQRRGIGVMLQDATLPESLRVAELVRLHASYYPQPRALAETLALAGLTDLARRPYAALSGGQQRRVQFALAICGRAPLVLIDEPSSGLDVEARRALWEVVRNLRREGTGIVLTTHYLEEADALADRIVVLAAGRVLAQGTPHEIKALAAGRRLCARTRLALDVMRSWPDAEARELSDGRIELRSRTPEAVLRRWLALDAELSELEVAPLSLEEAFVSLTRSADATLAQELAA